MASHASRWLERGCWTVAILSLPTGLCYATAWSAWRMGYAAWLGEPSVLGLYGPHLYVGWYIQASTAYPWAFRWPNTILLTAAALSMVAIVAARWLRKHRTSDSTDTFGSSRWADWRTIKKMGFLGVCGSLLGQIRAGGRWYFLRHMAIRMFSSSHRPGHAKPRRM